MSKVTTESKERPVRALTRDDIEFMMVELSRVQAFQKIILQTADFNCRVLQQEHEKIEAPATVSIRILADAIARLENLLKPAIERGSSHES